MNNNSKQNASLKTLKYQNFHLFLGLITHENENKKMLKFHLRSQYKKIQHRTTPLFRPLCAALFSNSSPIYIHAAIFPPLANISLDLQLYDRAKLKTKLGVKKKEKKKSQKFLG